MSISSASGHTVSDDVHSGLERRTGAPCAGLRAGYQGQTAKLQPRKHARRRAHQVPLGMTGEVILGDERILCLQHDDSFEIAQKGTERMVAYGAG